MDKPKEERRKYERFDTEVKIYFHVDYDIETTVKFQVVDKKKAKASSPKYSALSKNVSAEGLCFTSEKELREYDILLLEVYLPDEKNPILMEGEVRWSQPISSNETNKFNAGVKLITVNGRSVAESIYYDKANHVIWSIVLESILGSFKKFAQKIHKS